MFDSYICRRLLNAIIICFLLLIPTTVLHAQNNNRSHYELLWRINGPGLSSPSYLFGTMHMTESRVFEFSDSVLPALRNSASFAMEVDLDSMMAYMLAPGGPLLDTTNYMRRLLDEAEYRYIDSLVILKTGAPLDKLNLKRLWFIEKLLLDEEEELSKTADPNKKGENIFLDGWLHQKAASLHKPVHSLERIQNQLHFISADVSDMQKDMFLWSLGYHNAGSGDDKERTERLNSRVNLLDSFVNLYYEADLEKISNLVNSSDEKDDGPGLDVRNREMADNLALLINKGNIFAAVGVAHLPGEKGMLSLLRAKGFTVTPVKATFTGVAQRERKQLDSIKGYSLNKFADGYSVMFPGMPMAYPIPGSNRKMYIGNNDIEAGFAFAMDIPQLGTDNKEMVNLMIANMATQGNAVLQKSYPISYRDIPGTEAFLLQGKLPVYLRLFIRNSRVFVFMHSSGDKDSSSRKDFFKSVRFYDIVRPVALYDTLSNPQLGFSGILLSDVNHVKVANKKEVRPVEVYSGLDDANKISYVLRIEKMQRGYYNTDDKEILGGLRTLLIGQDSTVQLIDSTVTEKEGLPLYRLVYHHANGFTSRMHFIPRGNLAYCLVTTYDSEHTDSSYWKRFLNDFHMLPLQTVAPTVPFIAEDSSFIIKGPELFAGGPLGLHNKSSLVKVYHYTAMDSLSNSMYITEVDKYARYYHNEPDSVVDDFIHPADSNFIVKSEKRSVWQGLPVYETELKGRNTSLHWSRRAIVVGHTIYRLSVIQPEEVVSKNYPQQFFASFHPKANIDTFKLQQNTLPMLLKDLQSTDTTVFNAASAYLYNLQPDSADKASIISALAKPFPADTGTDSNAKGRLLSSLDNIADDEVVHASELLFADTKDISKRERILKFINGIASDSAVHTFLRLAPEMPESDANGSSIFSYDFRDDSLYLKYVPAMINTAERSESFLQAFTVYSSYDSLWLSPGFTEYGLDRLIPAITKQFERQLKEWQNRKAGEENGWMRETRLESTAKILALPGMPASAVATFRQMLTDTIISVRALGARGLISQGIKVNDSTLNSILADYNTSYTFIGAIKDNNQLPAISHLLTQELLGRSYLASYLSDEYSLNAIEQVTRLKVQQSKQSAAWLILYRYKTDESEDWEYMLSGPYEQSSTTLNFEPGLMYWLKDAAIVKDKKKLSAEAQKAYKEFLEEDDKN